RDGQGPAHHLSTRLRLSRRIARREAVLRPLVDPLVVARRLGSALFGIVRPAVRVPPIARRHVALAVPLPATAVAFSHIGFIHETCHRHHLADGNPSRSVPSDGPRCISPVPRAHGREESLEWCGRSRSSSSPRRGSCRSPPRWPRPPPRTGP